MTESGPPLCDLCVYLCALCGSKGIMNLNHIDHIGAHRSHRIKHRHKFGVSLSITGPPASIVVGNVEGRKGAVVHHNLVKLLTTSNRQIMEWTFEKTISTEKELRDIMGYPTEIVTRKTIKHIDEHCKSFIEKSPFIAIATSDASGNLDVSPKGDPAGFVKILSDKVLAIPDRPGNRKADTLSNIIQNPNIGLIFFIPGIRETLRVNGAAQIVTDSRVLELLSCQGKVPSIAIIVTVKEAFMHCAKCIIRSNLWTKVDDQQERTVPSLGRVLVDHGKLDISYQELDDMIKDDEKTNLY